MLQKIQRQVVFPNALKIIAVLHCMPHYNHPKLHRINILHSHFGLQFTFLISIHNALYLFLKASGNWVNLVLLGAVYWAYLSAGGVASTCPCCCCLCGTVGALTWQAAATRRVAEAFAVLSTNLQFKIHLCPLSSRMCVFVNNSTALTTDSISQPEAMHKRSALHLV